MPKFTMGDDKAFWEMFTKQELIKILDIFVDHITLTQIHKISEKLEKHEWYGGYSTTLK